MLKTCYEIADLLFVLFLFPREKRENPAGVAREGRRWRALTRNDDPEFATGLIIGYWTFCILQLNSLF